MFGSFKCGPDACPADRRWLEQVDMLIAPTLDLAQPRCQSALKFDPVSASNFDPFDRRVLAVALVSSELAGIAETRRARVGRGFWSAKFRCRSRRSPDRDVSRRASHLSSLLPR